MRDRFVARRWSRRSLSSADPDTLPMMLFALVLSLPLGCDSSPPPGEHRRYTDSLTAIEADPGQTGTVCGALTVAALREDCLLAGVDRLAAAQTETAAGLCQTLPDGLSRDECHFILAEKTGEATRCGDAGRFLLDCQMHLLQRAVSEAKLDSDPAVLEPAAAAMLSAGGFAAEDEHAWTLIYRDALARQAPLNLVRCDDTPRPPLCRRAGEGLFSDRLNYARDTRKLTGDWCTTRAGVEVLDHIPDAQLDALIARRTDVCP